jgi:hypothetical protein
MVRVQQSPSMTNAGHQMIITLYALSKGAGTGRKRAEMWQVIKDEELSNYKSIYTDGSLQEEKVGCTVVLSTATLKYRLLPETTIFNAVMYAILEATEHSKHMHCKTVIMADSLKNLTALERLYLSRNPTIPKILNLLAKEVKGNESTDKVAKKALHEEPAPNIRAAKKKERNEWLASL